MAEIDFSRILVCGDRDWANDGAIWGLLNDLHPTTVIEGHCRGADQSAHRWTCLEWNDVELVCRPANWKRYKRAAGPIRNREMLHNERPTFVLGFHNRIESSTGTADMLCVAEDNGVPYALLTESDCHG